MKGFLRSTEDGFHTQNIWEISCTAYSKIVVFVDRRIRAQQTLVLRQNFAELLQNVGPELSATFLLEPYVALLKDTESEVCSFLVLPWRIFTEQKIVRGVFPSDPYLISDLFIVVFYSSPRPRLVRHCLK